MTTRRTIAALGSLLALLAATTAVGRGPMELVVDGEVVDVQPITRNERVTRQTGVCDPVKPQGHDLVALLAWDLRTDCRRVTETREVVTGYQVAYVFDGQRFETRMDEAPGDTVPVRLVLH